KEIRIAIELIQSAALFTITLIEIGDDRQAILSDRLGRSASANHQLCIYAPAPQFGESSDRQVRALLLPVSTDEEESAWTRPTKSEHRSPVRRFLEVGSPRNDMHPRRVRTIIFNGRFG